MVKSAFILPILALTLIIGNPCFAEEGEENVAVMSDFSGGLNLEQNSFTVPKNQGTIVQNVRFDDESGSLTKREKTIIYGTASATEQILGMHRLYLDNGNKYFIVNHGDEIDLGNDTTGAFTKIFDVSTPDHKWQWINWKNIAIGMDGWNYPVKYNGTSIEQDGSVLFTDYSTTSYTITAVGNAQVDTAQKQIGKGSILLDGTGDYLTVPDNADWNFGTGNFTIDFWIRFNTASGDVGIISQEEDSNNRWGMYLAGGNTLKFIATTAGVSKYNSSASWTPTTGIWYHIAFVRNGSFGTCYVNGTQLFQGSFTGDGILGNNAHTLDVGELNHGGVGVVDGWMDEVRISKGIARWTAGFTPETSAYSNDTYTKLLIHSDGDLTGNVVTNLGAPLALASSTGTGPNGTYSYKVTCYSTTYKATLNNPSNLVTVANKSVNLSMIPICPDTILAEDTIGRKIYRIANGGSTYKLLSNGTIADNSTTTLVDSDADAALGASYPTGDEVITPPKGRFCALHNGRLWIGNNPTYPSRVYYSDVDSYETFYDDAYFDIRQSDGDQVAFIKNVLGVLTVGKTNTIQKIYDTEDNPDDWTISDPFSIVGCAAPYSVENTPYGLFYLSNSGIYMFNGQYSTLLSSPVSPIIEDISSSNFVNTWSAFYENTYYLAYTSNESGASFNNRILEYDSITKSFNIDILSMNAFCVFNSGTDIESLYGGSSVDGKVYAFTDTESEVVHKNMGDFTGTWDDARYIPIAGGGEYESPNIEIAWTKTIDQMVGTIDSATGIIDRPDTDGTYTSQYLTIGANKFDKLYWNEYIPPSGGDVNFYIRSGTTTTACGLASWSGPYTNSAGSDISLAPANTVAQYKINLTATDIKYTPYLYRANNFVVRLSYNRFGVTDESAIDFKWQSGWINIKPGYKITLKKLYMYHEYPANTAGTMNVTWENYEGDTDTFPVNLMTNPKTYKEYFTGGGLTGENFRFTIEENSLNPLKIRSMYVVFTVEPLV